MRRGMGRYITAGIVIVKRSRDRAFTTRPIIGCSYCSGPDRVGIKLDFAAIFGFAYERAQARGPSLPVAVCIGTISRSISPPPRWDRRCPKAADEFAVAGGLSGKPLTVAKAVSQDMIVPAEANLCWKVKSRSTMPWRWKARSVNSSVLPRRPPMHRS